ncbi:MAG: sugar ABC transporter substrate-binding protein [Fusobacteriota bacterium]
MKKRFLTVVAMMILVFSFEAMAKPIKLWYAWTGQEKEAMLSLVSKYQQVSGNEVDALMVPFDALQGKYQTMSPQGQGPDVIVGPGDWIGPFSDQNLIEPLDSYVSENTKKGFIQTVIDACKYDGKLYGLPESFKVPALIYNKDLLPEPPQTTDEMIEVGKKNTREGEAMYGLVYDKGNFYYHIGWIGGFGGTILDENNDPTFTSEAQIKAAKFIKSLQEEPNKIMPEQVDYNVMMTLFNQGLATMIINGPWVIGDLIDSGINFGISRLPKVSETGKWPAPTVGPEVVMLSANANNKDKAYDLVNFLTSKTAQINMAKIGHIPSRTSVYDDREVKRSRVFEYINAFRDQAEVGTPMPTAPEMAAGIWSNGNTMLSNVLSGTTTAEEAAADVQEKAEESISVLRNN